MSDSAPTRTRRHRTVTKASLAEASPASAAVYVVGVLLALLLLLGVSFEALLPLSRLLTLGGVAVLVLLLGLAPGLLADWRALLLRGCTPFALALLAWTVIRYLIGPTFIFSLLDLLRILAGVVAYLLVAYATPLRRAQFSLGVGLVGIGLLVGLINLSLWGAEGGLAGGTPTTFFATHETTGSLLMLLLPLPLAFAVYSKVGDGLKLGGFAASLLLAIALLLTRTRSSYAGTILGVAVLTYLTLYRKVQEARQARNGPGSQRTTGGTSAPASTASTAMSRGLERVMTSPVLLIVLAILALSLIYGTTSSFYLRAASSQELGDSLGTRLEMWRGGVLMLQEKPLIGWGVGAYLSQESLWTHLGRDPRMLPLIGANHLNIAHDYYVQWAADTGIVGLILHVGVIAGFLAMALTSVRRLKLAPREGALLTGITAALAASVVDAISSPSYNFADVSTLWWILLGMGVALLESASVRQRRGVPQVRPENLNLPALPYKPVVVWAIAPVAGLLVAAGLLGWAMRLREQGTFAPEGHLRIVATIRREKYAGNAVCRTWTAIFTDGDGKSLSTLPGTAWRGVNTPSAVKAALRLEYQVKDAVPDEASPPMRSTLYVPLSFAPPQGDWKAKGSKVSKGRVAEGTDNTDKAEATDDSADSEGLQNDSGGVGNAYIEARYIDRYGRHYRATAPLFFNP